jgi:hypothetical protein
VKRIRPILGIIFLVTASHGFGQAMDSLFTARFEHTSLEQAVTELENQTDFVFFYDPSWLDTLTVDGAYESENAVSILTLWLQETPLHLFRDGQNIILTDNLPIIDHPAILSILDQEIIEEDDVTSGLIFSREYADAANATIPTIEIGNRKTARSGDKVTLAGYIYNSENEPVEGVLLYTDQTFHSTTSDATGFYTLSLPTGKHLLLSQFVGLKTTPMNLVIFSNGKLDIQMETDVIALQEITVESTKDENVTDVKMGVSKINIEEAKNIPIVLGERDVMKIAITKPGVQSTGEGASGINVRGGRPDQNLILLEDGTVYNPNHFFGFFSVFNSDAIQGLELFKASVPVTYDSRLSSVFDISVRKPSKDKTQGMFSISPITSKFTIEGPLFKEKTSFLLSGRTTYSNWILSQTRNADFKDNKVSFYDVILHLDHTFSENSQLYVSAYASKDKFRLTSDTLFSFSDFSYQNRFVSARWEYRFNPLWKHDLIFSLSNYRYDLIYDESIPNAFQQFFDLKETSVKSQFSYFPDKKQQIDMGVSIKRYTINPGEKLPLSDESVVLARDLDDEYGYESALFLSDSYDLRPNLTLYGGIRYVVFNLVGPQSISYYAEGAPKTNETVTDTKQYTKGESISIHHGPEWRLSNRYQISQQSSVKLSVNRNRQYIHSLSNTASLSPTDIWRLTSPHIKPQIADQLSLGYYRNLFGNMIELSLEGYHKWIQNLVDFKIGADFLLNPYIERVILQGKGRSYGLELSLQKSGRLNGWLNYTYARSFIKIDGSTPDTRINNGDYYPTGFDKPHSLNVIANYKISRRFSCSINGTYNTGRPVTLPIGAFQFKGTNSIFFSERNNFRIPDYFRLDMGINLEGNHRIRKLAHTFWSFSVYNLTGRDNPFSVFVDVKEEGLVGSQLIVFGDPIPTLSFNAKF